MELEQLRIFLAVAELTSFRRAAAAMYISRSTVSRAVASLEASLDVRLFERTSRSVRLTKAGRLLCREGEGFLQRADQLREAVQNAGDSPDIID